MQYTEEQLSNLIKDVEKEFSVALAKAEDTTAQPVSLAKAEDEKPSEDKKPSDEKPDSEPKAKEDNGESKAPKADAAPEAKPEGEQAAAPAAEAAQPTGEAPVAPAADEGASGYDAEDIAHMDQMYLSMSKAELLAHHDSCVRALDAIGAEHTHAAAPAAAPAPAAAAPAEQAPAAAAPAEIDKCGDMSMSKTEQTPAAPVADVQKSETDLLKSENESLKKNMAGITEFLTALVKKTPQGKAITSLEQVSKSEGSQSGEVQLSKAEITAILSKKAAEPTLAKADRDAINAFYLNNTNINTISHLLK